MCGPVPLSVLQRHGENRPAAARAGTLLLVGYVEDLCCRLVAQAVGPLGYDIVVTADPLAAPFSLHWRFGTEAVDDVPAWGDADGASRDVAGVLVRASGGPATVEGWAPKDLAYTRTESQAALIAWLWSLPCPVINRPRTDIWFRPHRPYPEWHELFRRCGLPTLAICVTNSIETAHDFSARSGGATTYSPLTSSSRYPITEPRHWQDLAKVVAHVPVCLMESGLGRSTHATVVGGYVVWNEGAPGEAIALEPALLHLGDELGLDLVQVEIAVGSAGPRCITADPYPVFERHDARAQAALTARLVDLLCAGRRAAGRIRPPEVRHLTERAAE
jgi:hypothetical protein